MRTTIRMAAMLLLLGLVSLTDMTGLVGQAHAEQPSDVVRTAVDEIMAVLRDPKYKDPGKFEEQKEHLKTLAEKFIDKQRFAQITLGRDWRRFSPAEQKEFVDLYADLVEQTYIDRIREYTDEEVRIIGEARTAENRAEVNTVVVSKGKEIPVVYRMHQGGGQWRVYDVLVEGVSLVMNYRSQFNNILASGSPERLLEQLRQRVRS